MEDRYGLSWQLIYFEGRVSSKNYAFTFVFRDSYRKSTDAITYYTNVLQNGKIFDVYEYESGQASAEEAKIAHATFEIMGLEMIAADHAQKVDYQFNEVFLYDLMCHSREIDYYWDKLSAQ